MKKQVLLVIAAFLLSITVKASAPLNVNPIKVDLDKVSKISKTYFEKQSENTSKFYYIWEVETERGTMKGASLTKDLAEKAINLMSESNFVIGHYLIRKKK